MHSINERLTEIYVFVDDYLKQHPHRAQWRRSNNHETAFSDGEVITISLMQGYFGTPTLARTYELAKPIRGVPFHVCAATNNGSPACIN